jgi:uncharacterized protein involved in outer membrane biogenesis
MSDQVANPPTAPSKEKPAKRHRFLKAVGVVLAILVVLVALLPYIIPATWLAATIETAVKSHVRGTVKLGAVSWGWLGGVRVDDVVIGETSEFGGGTFLKVSRVSVSVSFLDLLQKKLTVKSVTVDSPVIKLTRNEQGAWNFEKLFAGDESRRPVAVAAAVPAPAGGGFDVAVRRVRVKGGSVDFHDQKQRLELQATGIDADINADFSDPTKITGAASLSFDLAQPDGLGRFELAAGNLSVPRTPGPQALQETVVTGTVSLTDIDIAEAVAAAQPQYGRDLAGGKLTLVMDYELNGGTIKAKARTGAVKSLVLGTKAGMAAPVAVGDVAFAFDAVATQKPTNDVDATLGTLTLTTSFLELSASGKAAITGDGTAVTAKASGTVDPAKLPKGLVTLPPDLQTSGRAKFDVAVEGNPAPGKFAATVDAGDMHVVYGSVLKKEPGIAAAVAASGVMSPSLVTADKLNVTLAGGTLAGSGTFDQANKTAAWNLNADFQGVNTADYYPGSKPVTVAGAFTHSGKFFLETPKRASDFVVDTKFNNFSLDVKDKPGVEVQISGTGSANTARAQASNLVVTLGGMPITIDADVQTPLAKPNGNITVRGKEISIDSLMAVADALKSAVPASTAPAAEKAPAPEGGKTPAEKAEAAGKLYINNANVNLDLAIDKMIYQNYTGTNLVVDAGLLAGKAVVRKAQVDIFGGTVNLTAQTDLLSSDVPVQANLTVAKVRAGDVAQPFVSKWLPGLPLSNSVDVGLSASGKMGAATKDALGSFNGKGAVDISDGTLSLGGLPGPVSAILGIAALDNIAVPKLNIPLDLQNGTLQYAFAVPAGKYRVTVEVTAHLSGEYKQRVGLTLPETGQTIHLFALENGKRVDVDVKEILADVAKAQLAGALLGKTAPEGQVQEKPSKEEQAIDIGGAIVDILTNKQKDSETKQKK